VDEVHDPDLVRPRGLLAVFAQLRLHPALQVLIPELQAQLIVHPAGLLHVDLPAFPAQQHMHAVVAIAHACLCNLLDPSFDGRLVGARGFVVEREGVELKGSHKPRGSTRPNRCTFREPVRASGQASELSADDVLQHHSVELEIRHDLLQPALLASSDFNQRISSTSNPPYRFFQLK